MITSPIEPLCVASGCIPSGGMSLDAGSEVFGVGVVETKAEGPIHILSLGAGVQSSTLALMAACGEVTPMPMAAIFADTQAEPASVYRWLDWLEKQLPFPVIRVTKGSLTNAALTVKTSKKGNTYTNSNVPAFMKLDGVARAGKQMRQCTKDFKIDPILQQVRRMASKEIKVWRKDRSSQVPVIQWIGISRDEVTRMKPSRLPYILHRWPLVDAGIRRSGCVAWMKEKGFPTPPRSACVYCPFHSNQEWLRLKREDPESFEKAAVFEDNYQKTLSRIQRRTAVPFLHRSLIPLRKIDFELQKDTTPDLFGNECEGICGV